MRDGDLEDEAVTALDLSGPHKVGEAERSRMFWARVKAEETLNAPGTNLGARVPKVLHLPPGTRPNGYRDTLLDLLTRAFAAGRDATDPDVAAAYDLDESGVYATTGVSTTALRQERRRARLHRRADADDGRPGPVRHAHRRPGHTVGGPEGPRPLPRTGHPGRQRPRPPGAHLRRGDAPDPGR